MKEKAIIMIRFLAPLALLFAVVFTGLRVYEFVLLSSLDKVHRLEALGFLYDWPFACDLVVITSFIGILVGLISTKAGKIASIVLYGFILISSFLIIQYFSVTHVPLSADLFGYSIDDIKTTVSSSGGIDFSGIISLLIYISIFIVGCIFIWKNISNKISLRGAQIVLGVIMFISFIPVKPAPENFKEDVHYNLVVNKPEYFLNRSITYFRESSSLDLSGSGYPFLHEIKYRDVLGSHLNNASDKPNLVFLFIEGLGKDFTGPQAVYGGFTPFLDSLTTKSLYWKNALSNTGRTFGVLPSALGSLPYGKDGFMGYGIDMPDHQTLISLLKDKSYAANYFYGGSPNFDNQDIFLQYQGVDYMLSETNFPLSYEKAAANAEGFSWGYADRDVLNYSLEVLNERNTSPRIDVYLTLSTHEPFISPDEKFNAQFQQMLNASTADESTKSTLTEYSGVFTCLLYTDDALRQFFEKYKKRPEFEKTIFVITGDHRLIPVPQATKLSRFRVPLIIYSPLIKQPKTFESIVNHADITPALLGFLQNNYEMQFPASMPFISENLDTATVFSSRADVAMMRNKGEVNDYMFGEYFLSDGVVYEISSSMDIEPVKNDSVGRIMTEKLRSFKTKSLIACERNLLDKGGSGKRLKLFKFTDREKEYIEDQNLAGLKPDEAFKKGQELAFAKNYDQSRIVLRYLLNKSPNYHDARILLGRTFAWNSGYDSAKSFYDEVLKRSPSYDDAYSAYSDVDYWEGDIEHSLAMCEEGLKSNPTNIELKARKARALLALGRKSEAYELSQQVLKESPAQEVALDVNKRSQP